MKRRLALAVIVPCAAIAAPAHADVVIGPRAAYYFDNSNLRTSSIPSGQIEEGVIDEQALELARTLYPGEVDFVGQQEGAGVLADQISIPMAGLMINFGDDRDRITLSGLYGQGSGSFSQTQSVSRTLTIQNATAVDFGLATAAAEFDYDRLDLEATWQRRTSETFAFLVGVRYERLERKGDGIASIGLTPNVDNLLLAAIAAGLNQPPPAIIPQQPLQTIPITDSATQETYSIRGGVTAFVPISDNATAFFNGMAHASYQPEFTVSTVLVGDGVNTQDSTLAETTDAEISLGPDFAVGAQFILSEGLALDVRYRANLFFPLSGEQDFSDARVNHGVNLGLSLRI
jgi:hypothetical protein